MSGSAASDPRDRDDELLSRIEGGHQQPVPPADDGELQRLLDRATGGLRPHWRNSPEDKLPDGRCVVYNGSSQGARCPRDATVSIWIGCGHEHMAASGVCGFHETEIRQAKFGWQCSLCRDATGELVLAYYIRTDPLENADLGSS